MQGGRELPERRLSDTLWEPYKRRADFWKGFVCGMASMFALVMLLLIVLDHLT